MPARRLPAALSLVAVAALGLGACGSSSSSSKVDAPDTGVSTTTVAPPTSASSTGAPQAPGTPLLASGPVPSVTGATDLTKEPTIAPGTGTPPTTPTGQDLVVGHGTVAGPAATVTVQYVGTIYETGKVFDASWDHGQPVQFPLNGVIPGFKDAIVGMAVGGRREVVIPPAEGYGASGQGPIPPNSTLVFVIDLVQVQ